MENIFDNLAFAESVFLKETYSQILSEINLKRHGEIVRRLISEGYDLVNAELLYQTIVSNPERTRNLLHQLEKEISEKEKRQEDEYAKERERERQKELENKKNNELSLQNEKARKEAMHTFTHMGQHMAVHFIIKAFGFG